MPRSTDLGIVYPPSDLRPGIARSLVVRFGAAGTVGSVRLPAGILGVALYPRINDVRFSLDVIPEPAPIIPLEQPVESAEMSAGAIAKGNLWTRRFLPADGQVHTLYVRNENANTTVDIEVW